MPMKNVSQAAENNKQVIFDQLSGIFSAPGEVLEIGSGAGQHAIHIARQLTHLTWQPADQGSYFDPLVDNIREFAPDNVLAPIYLDVNGEWPAGQFQYVFSANVLHIMPATLIEPFFAGIGQVLNGGGICCVYGPFRYHGEFTTESNARFDQWLKGNNPESGIRDFEIVTAVAEKNGLVLQDDLTMPANNQLLKFERAAR